MKNEIEIRKIGALKPTGNKIYDSYVHRFNSFLNGRPVSMELVIQFIKEMKKQYKPSTIGTMKAALKKSIILTLDKKDAQNLMVLAMLDSNLLLIHIY